MNHKHTTNDHGNDETVPHRGHSHDHSHSHSNSHSNPHAHSHSHAHDRNLSWAFVGNLILSLIQVIGGVASGSLALVADALHNLSDSASLLLALVARKIARRRPDRLRTYGYRRVETLSAFTNYVALILVSCWLAIEAITRFFTPHEVAGLPLIWISSLAVFINLGTVALTYRGAKESQNIRAAYLHNLGDAVSSIGVIVAGLLILAFDWYWIDPLLTLAISGYILWQISREIMPVINILIDAAPHESLTQSIESKLMEMPQIAGIHHLHLRSLDEHNLALEAHIVMVESINQDELRHAIKLLLKSDFDIAHASLELEITDCGTRKCFD